MVEEKVREVVVERKVEEELCSIPDHNQTDWEQARLTTMDKGARK